MEFTALQTLEHPYIVLIKEIYEQGEQINLVSEWALGGSMEQFLGKRREDQASLYLEKKVLEAENKHLDEADLLRYFTMIALALEQTHHQGLLHRNISSGHIYLSLDNTSVKLGSHANVVLKEEEEERTGIAFCGEWHYLAPEVVAGGGYTR